MSALAKILIERLTQSGPMNLAQFMAECLMHPQHGYYTQQQVFGRSGDFVTAPGVSQMFGEMIGLSLAQSWVDQGRPENAILVELGPGEGTLMADIKRVAKAVPGFDTLPVHMVENSIKLREKQSAAVPGVIHHAEISDLPDVPRFIIANEFFDALPMRQFIRAKDGWQECFVGAIDGQLQYGKGPITSPSFLAHRLADTKVGDVVEHCPALPSIVQSLGQGIAKNGGAALILDYGDWRSQGNTLQGIEDHKTVHTLKAPGENDITAHVDFEAIARAAQPAIASNMITQGVFLERLGITKRAQDLAKNLDGPALNNHIAAHRRLTHPEEMGKLFKVIGLAPSADLLPTGLAG